MNSRLRTLRTCTLVGILLIGSVLGLGVGSASASPVTHEGAVVTHASATGNATTNLTTSLDRLVILAGLAAGAVVSLAWVRVALSWFSSDPSKKITAKDRARDALLGTFILLAAVSGLAWGLANWVLTGT